MASPTVVYIVSRGHSGSTLLDLLLSTHSQVVSVGELKQIARREDPSCTCEAERVRSCPFWTRVDEGLRASMNCGLVELPIEDDDAVRFRRANHALYEEVADRSGASVVVDSSKDHHRMARLLADGSFELRPIHLVRNPCGVVFSNVRKERDWWAATLRYARGLKRAHDALAGHPHRRVRYEELARRPEETLRGLMTWLGLSFEPEQLQFAGRPRHNIGGNRMRFGTRSEIHLDDAWRRGLPLHHKAGIFLATLPARLRAR